MKKETFTMLNVVDHDAPNESAYSAIFLALKEKNTMPKLALIAVINKTIEFRTLINESLGSIGGFNPK